MKPSVAIALIIVGGILVALPPISDCLWRADALRMVEKTGMSSGTLDGKMDGIYRIGCIMAGVGSIATSVIFSTARLQGKLIRRDDPIE